MTHTSQRRAGARKTRSLRKDAAAVECASAVRLAVRQSARATRPWHIPPRTILGTRFSHDIFLTQVKLTQLRYVNILRSADTYLIVWEDGGGFLARNPLVIAAADPV